MAKLAEYKKAIAAFVGAAVPVYSIVIAQDWSTKNGLIAAIVPVVAALVTALSPKNAPKAA